MSGKNFKSKHQRNKAYEVPDREQTKMEYLFFRKQKVLAFPSYIFYCVFF